MNRLSLKADGVFRTITHNRMPQIKNTTSTKNKNQIRKFTLNTYRYFLYNSNLFNLILRRKFGKKNLLIKTIYNKNI